MRLQSSQQVSRDTARHRGGWNTNRRQSGYYIRGPAWYMKKEYTKGVKDFDEAIRLNPKDAEALNSRAWAAATCPDAKHRNRAKALDYAKRACELDGWKNPFYLGTLAAAHAENGEFACG